ncbi:MAG: sodium/proton-translocating pyrophosphatase, partial [Mailhella sp.]|nr:sodium/proton-translocating pyrophosphatase [Mailhella sp.]
MTFISLVVVFACAAFALLYASKTAKNILAASTGNAEMQRIAGAIQEGAQAYLSRQYRTIAIVGAVVTVLLFVFMSFFTALG